MLKNWPRSDEDGSRQSPPQTQSDFDGYSTQHPSATVTSGAYQALAEAAEESFSEPSYVVVNETVKQFRQKFVKTETSKM